MERAQSCPFYGRNMDEYVFRAIIGLNKSIALLGVKPLYCSACHCTFLQTRHAAIQHWVAGQISARNRKQVRRSNELGNADEPRESTLEIYAALAIVAR